MARKAGQGKEEEESRARQQEEKTPVRDEEKTPACDGRAHHVVEQEEADDNSVNINNKFHPLPIAFSGALNIYLLSIVLTYFIFFDKIPFFPPPTLPAFLYPSSLIPSYKKFKEETSEGI
ncbi:hypothetical protein STEG23_023421, partial [Scotinomys teguina]